ncbi:MAG: carbamoyltransferase C-terminal domain-containing protein [Candidatus Aenigmarchaeota archaeon]|nr:carbamoyltransferase C-terminal domain-containing protein [Candidatus Aenigmarchaeota archaeon]
MYILGIWDGHDCGAAIVEDDEIKVAVNEERFTRRKLEVGFPENSIKCCLDFLELKPTDISHIAITTTDFAKTLTRIFPSMKESYYLFRRRMEKPRFEHFRRNIKYRTTELNEKPLCRRITKWYFKKNLKKMGFEDFDIHIVEHHLAHAVTASYCSGFKKALIITMDGVGDGLSATVNVYNDGEIERLSETLAKDSIGIFFEQVTNLLGFRELEDEGKVMALSDYAYTVPDEENKLLNLFTVNGLRIQSNQTTASRYKLLNKILWNTPREEFSYMAQRTLEKNVVQLFQNAIEETGLSDVCWAGGVASNIKANMKIKDLPDLKRWFIFPHMGDGGLAIGAALYVNHELNGSNNCKLDDVFLGPEYPEDEIEKSLKNVKEKVKFEERDDIARFVGDFISNKNFVLWYQGRMEIGPRALGNRSILAPAFSLEIKDELNLHIKKRNWFQPFCPSLLKEEAEKFFVDIKGYDKFMTMGYRTRPEVRERVKAVINIDGSARPQMLEDENPRYRRLIEQVKKNTGDGIILNTSFNLHGEPIVCTPKDALETMVKTRTKYMALGNFFIELK